MAEWLHFTLPGAAPGPGQVPGIVGPGGVEGAGLLLP